MAFDDDLMTLSAHFTGHESSPELAIYAVEDLRWLFRLPPAGEHRWHHDTQYCLFVVNALMQDIVYLSSDFRDQSVVRVIMSSFEVFGTRDNELHQSTYLLACLLS